MLSQKIIEKEFTLSGSEQNPDLTGKDVRLLAKSRLGKGAGGPVQAFMDQGADFIVRDTLDELIAGMQALPGGDALDAERVRLEVEARDREIDNDFTKDAQIAMLRSARAYRGDQLIRTAAPHRILDPKSGPLIAVKLHVLTRKSLGGIETDLAGRALAPDGEPVPGLYAAGEASGFGGGGMHGYRALEGTFLGGCLFSGRTAGRARPPRSSLGAQLARRSGRRTGGEPDSRRAADDDVAAPERHPRPRPADEDPRILLADDEAERDGGEGDAERQAVERVVRPAPDGRAHRAHDVLARILGQRLGDRRDPPLRAGGEDGCRDRRRAAHPPRGGAIPAQAGDSAVSGSVTVLASAQTARGRMPRRRGRRRARGRPAACASRARSGSHRAVRGARAAPRSSRACRRGPAAARSRRRAVRRGSRRSGRRLRRAASGNSR